MSLASELVTLTEEIKAKQTPWLALSAKANDDKQTLTPEEKDTLTASNRDLTELIDKKVVLENQITSQAALKAKVDGMTAVEQESTEKNRSSAPKDKGGESWAVKAAKAMVEDFPSKDKPHRIEKELKALFVEGAFTAGTAAGVPGYYEPANDQGYPPELRRRTVLVHACCRASGTVLEHHPADSDEPANRRLHGRDGQRRWKRPVHG